jgi:rubrerythrin
MPQFQDPFSGNDLPRKYTEDELIRAVRLAIAAEYEAAQLYEQIATASSDPLVQVVMASVAREELVHAGEFLELLGRLSPDEMVAYDEGSKEVKSLQKKLGG